jgi:ribonuclease P protein component
MNYKFPKSEKLRLKKDLDQLFKNGHKIFKYPLTLVFLSNEGLGKNLCAVSVPKRKFKKAVDRNRIKRQMREAYRLNKHKISSENKYFHMMFVYSISEKLEYQKIENAVIKLMNEANKK